MRDRRPHFEQDDATFPAEAYTASGWGAGIAWRVYGWETAPDEDTEWSGIEERTGRVVAVMVGDDRRFTFELAELEPLDELDYCLSCGQVGCTHDGRDRCHAKRMSPWKRAQASGFPTVDLFPKAQPPANGELFDPAGPPCSCDFPRFVSPDCARHGAQEYHEAPDRGEAC